MGERLATFSRASASLPSIRRFIRRQSVDGAASARLPHRHRSQPNMTPATETSLPARSNRATLTIPVEALLSRLHPVVERERRHDDRVTIAVLFHLTPYDADRRPLDEEASIVVGKNISRRGVSFYHEKPITHRRALI